MAFKDEYVDQARRLALLGLIDDEVAKFLCVTSQTIHNWKKRYPEFAEALNQGKLGPDSEVVMSLYKRATGFSHEAVKIFMTEDGPVYAPYTERYPPDTTACIFWLKNRQPEQWRDKIDHDLTSNGETLPALLFGFVEKEQAGDGAKLINGSGTEAI